MGSFPETLIDPSCSRAKARYQGPPGAAKHIPVHSIIILRSYNYSFCNFCLTKFAPLDLVVQVVDNAIHRINHYPLDNAIGFPNIYPLDRDLSGG